MKRHTKKIPFATALIMIGLYVGLAWFFSGMIISPPSRGGGPENESRGEGRDRKRSSEIDIAHLGEPERVRIRSGDITLAGSYFENSADCECGVILLPGRGGRRSGSLRFAPLYWSLGCDVLAYDLRGAGDSSPGYQTFGYYDKEDASAAVDWLSDRSGITPFQVGIMGSSYGSAVALQTLSKRSDLAFVIADSTFSSLESVVTEHAVRQFGPWVKMFVPAALFFAGVRADFDPYAVSPAESVAQSSTPVLLIHGADDDTTAASHSEIVYEGSNPATTVLEITDWGPGHVSSIRHKPRAYESIIHSFLESHVSTLELNTSHPKESVE